MCGGSGDDLGEGLKRGRWGWMLGPKMVVTPRLKYRLLSLKAMQNHPLPKRRERHQVERERRGEREGEGRFWLGLCKN